MYTHIDIAVFNNFNEYWDKNYALLPPLPNLVHNYEDGKAAVFNTWLRNSKLYDRAVIKSEKLFTHCLVEQVSQKFRALIDFETKDYILSKMPDEQFHFLFSYFITFNVMQHLENFLNTPEFSYLKTYIPHDYYASSMDDYNTDDPIFYFIKQINSHYIHKEITPQLVQKLYKYAIHQSELIINRLVQNSI